MKQDEQQKLEKLKEQALQLMRDGGFVVREDVTVRVDPDLAFMGYTTERDGKPVIVVSGNALASGMVVNLLIHELSHVYRSQTGHPSHDYQLLTGVTTWVMHGKVVLPYQEEILQTILNHIQDLYADDISFAIFKKHNPQNSLNEFFMSWIHTPLVDSSIESLWTNAGYLLSSAFAEANLKRHHIVDTDKKVAKAIQEFLSHCDKRLVEKYEYFKDFMVDLPEEVTDKEFEKLLIGYLSEFVKLTKIS